jgi:pyoverdine/dityrosine biosynthesis protein Dit1
VYEVCDALHLLIANILLSPFDDVNNLQNHRTFLAAAVCQQFDLLHDENY